MSKIYGAMCDLHADIDGLTKGDYNQMQRFNFRGIDAVYNYIHEKMSKYRVFSVPTFLRDLGTEERTTRAGGLIIIRRYEIKYTFYTDDGSSVEAVVIGEAQDTGDKASNKCLAIAHKYAIIQVFDIPTEEQKDPDAEAVELAPQLAPLEENAEKLEGAKKYIKEAEDVEAAMIALKKSYFLSWHTENILREYRNCSEEAKQ